MLKVRNRSHTSQMMPIQLIKIIKVIFVLSTIVTGADCCSSRMLLLREHTLKIVQHQHNFHNHLHEHAHQLQQQGELQAVQLAKQMVLQQQLLGAGQSGSDTEQILLEWQNLVETVSASTTAEPSSYVSTSWPTSEQTSPTTDTATGEPPPESSPTTVTISTHIDAESETTTETSVTSNESPLLKPLTEACSGYHETNFCLNAGHCLKLQFPKDIILSCRCTDGFVGERCESKSVNGLVVPASPSLDVQPKILMARVVFSFPMLMLLSTIYVGLVAVYILCSVPAQRRKQQQLRLHKQRLFVS